MYLGEMAAILAALCWTLNSVLLEKKGSKFSPVAINFGRQFIAFILMGTFLMIFNRSIVNGDLTSPSMIKLVLSGLVGFTIGDSFLFSAFKRVGAKLTLLIFTLSPGIAAIFSYFLFDETLSLKNIIGMIIVLIGIAIVILMGPGSKIKLDKVGILFAFLATFGQAFGVILSKYGLKEVDPLTATELRLLGGLFGITLICIFSNKIKDIKYLLTLGDGRLVVLSSAILGTSIGVALSMVAVKLTKVAIASTLMSTSPILIIPILYLIYREKINGIETIGAIMSVIGVALLF